MKILLDTCTFLWLAEDSAQLSQKARESYEDPLNEVFLSVISSWEIAVKSGLGKLPLPDPPEVFIPEVRDQMGVQSLPLDEEATLYLPRLPSPHRDPFDRILVCQAICHGMVLLTPDPKIREYPVRQIW